ncbi:MAG: hypothetical protein JO276_12625 [Sphingomonadaceae bacterium]|nr:hypothetical protein [Sphingomonadaceae bacterium]
MFAKSAALLAAASLAASPAFAQPSAAPLSLQPMVERAGGPMHGSGQLNGGSILPPILFLAIVIGGVLLATGVIGANHHPPRSP